jgi:methylated-DNA-[protein]-cysteine S-methyltransferase
MPCIHHVGFFVSPIGTLCIADDGDAVVSLGIVAGALYSDETVSPLILKTKQELDEYFAGKRQTFDIPLHLHGTDFQRAVWNALLRISYGTTCCYSDIAAAAGRPSAVRAAGGAVHRNPVMILVPCHRVIGKNGSLTGFGAGVPVKRFLLDWEQSCQ